MRKLPARALSLCEVNILFVVNSIERGLPSSPIKILRCIFILVALLGSNASLSAQEKKSFRIIGYLPDYRLKAVDDTALTQLTDLILFSAEIRADGGIDMSRLRDTPWEKIDRIRTLHPLRVILCVGGWERSQGFAAVATKLELRQRFVEESLKLCQQYRLNGIDLDWEHPKNESEQTGYATILADLRRAFHTKSLSVSMTMAAWQQVPRVAFEAVDFVQIMSYDKPMQHSTLKDAINDIEKLSSDGAPRSKLVLGIPFYGRHTKTPDQTKTYREIVERWNPSPSSDEVEGYYFNGPETIAAKTRYARDHGLAGVMIWEVGQDASGEQSLLKKISFAAKLDGEQK